MTKRRSINAANAFNATLRQALDHFADSKWLGENSILATPYFLGQHNPTSPDAKARGEALQNVFYGAMADLWSGELPTTREALIKQVNAARQKQGNKGAIYYYYLLELRYLRQYFSIRTEPTRVADIYGFINVSETRFHEHLRQATAELGKILLRHIQPTLRLERPFLSKNLIGRDDVLAQILSNLESKRTVAISGNGGVGKTTLGTAIHNKWSISPTFWYTFRPGLNVNLDNVLFSLGHFLHQSGASDLWLQLLANEGKITDIHQALGFLRNDILTLPELPLLCFDEVDLLQTTNTRSGEIFGHQLLEFVDSLRGLSPVLLVGQRSVLDTDDHYVLQPLTLPKTQILLKQANIQLNKVQLKQVQRYTAGNPRLLELYANLFKTGDEATDLLQLHTSPSAQPLFYRLWKRLDPQERDILSLLAVFRTQAPRDIWQKNPNTLNDLIQRNLVTLDQADGVAILPFFRQLIYHELPSTQQKELHGQAAIIRAERGDFTAATYHYVQAENFTAAVQLWYLHQDQEILRGQTQAARDIFQNILHQQVQGKTLKQLKIIQNRLYLLAGEAEVLLDNMMDADWSPDEEITADMLHQMGMAQAILGQTDAALESYDEAITTLARLTTKIIEKHFHRGQMFFRQEINTQAARREAQIARYQVEYLEGAIEMIAKNFDKAQTHYNKALSLVQSINEDTRIAKVHQRLALVAGFRGKVDLAIEHAEVAMQHFEQTGNRVQLESMRADLAGVYLGAKQFERVIEPAEKALKFFEGIKHEPWIAPICNNLAEAYCELGQLEKAKTYAFRVLDLENPRMRPHALYTLGLIHQKQGSAPDAEACFHEGIQLAQQNEDTYMEAHLRRVLGQLHLEDKQLTQGKAEIEEARDLFSQMGLTDEVKETEKLLQK